MSQLARYLRADLLWRLLWDGVEETGEFQYGGDRIGRAVVRRRFAPPPPFSFCPSDGVRRRMLWSTGVTTGAGVGAASGPIELRQCLAFMLELLEPTEPPLFERDPDPEIEIDAGGWAGICGINWYCGI